jgi:hypothetical protein
MISNILLNHKYFSYLDLNETLSFHQYPLQFYQAKDILPHPKVTMKRFKDIRKIFQAGRDFKVIMSHDRIEL